MHFNATDGFLPRLKKDLSYKKANGATALKTGPRCCDKDANLSVVFTSLKSVFSPS